MSKKKKLFLPFLFLVAVIILAVVGMAGHHIGARSSYIDVVTSPGGRNAFFVDISEPVFPLGKVTYLQLPATHRFGGVTLILENPFGEYRVMRDADMDGHVDVLNEEERLLARLPESEFKKADRELAYWKTELYVDIRIMTTVLAKALSNDIGRINESE